MKKTLALRSRVFFLIWSSLWGIVLFSFLGVFSTEIYAKETNTKTGFNKEEQTLIWRAYEIRATQNTQQNKKRFVDDLKKASEEVSEQTKLIVQNLLTLDEIPSMYQNNQAKKVYLVVTKQERACKNFIEVHNDKNSKNHKNKILDKWFYVTCGDILSRGLAFTARDKIVEKSSLAKTYYLTALKIDNKFSPAYISYGLWQYHAPAIAGGGLDASLKSFNKALAFAKRKNTRYLSYVYRSQVYFAMNRNKEWDADLKSAHAVFPYESETFTKYIREKNTKQGLSLFAH